MAWIRHGKWWLLAAAALLVLGAAVALPRLRPPEVEVAEARSGHLSLRIAASGIVEADTCELSFQCSGIIDELLTGSRRYDIDLQFTHPEGLTLGRAMLALPGATGFSRTASLPVRVSSSWGSGELMLTGLERNQRFLRIHSGTGDVISVSPRSIWLPRQLGERLHVEPGDPVRVTWVRSTRQRRLSRTMRVAGLLDVAMGSTAYGEFHDVMYAAPSPTRRTPTPPTAASWPVSPAQWRA